jgi:hypothetical protein
MGRNTSAAAPPFLPRADELEIVLVKKKRMSRGFDSLASVVAFPDMYLRRVSGTIRTNVFDGSGKYRRTSSSRTIHG